MQVFFASTVWNTLPNNVKSANVLITFRRRLSNNLPVFFSLNITTEGTPGKTPSRNTAAGSRKRKRMMVSSQGGADFSHMQSTAQSSFNATSSSTGVLEISDTDVEGQFIKIHNPSDKVCMLFSCVVSFTAKL